MNYPIEKLGHTVDEACHAIGIRRTKLYAEIKVGRLKRVKAGSRTIIVNVPEYIELLKTEAGHVEAA